MAAKRHRGCNGGNGWLNGGGIARKGTSCGEEQCSKGNGAEGDGAWQGRHETGWCYREEEEVSMVRFVYVRRGSWLQW